MATNATHTAKIEIERDDARAEYDNFDEYDVIIQNPMGSFPSGMYEQVDERIREEVDLSQLRDGQRLPAGTVTYDAESVVEIAVGEYRA